MDVAESQNKAGYNSLQTLIRLATVDDCDKNFTHLLQASVASKLIDAGARFKLAKAALTRLLKKAFEYASQKVGLVLKHQLGSLSINHEKRVEAAFKNSLASHVELVFACVREPVNDFLATLVPSHEKSSHGADFTLHALLKLDGILVILNSKQLDVYRNSIRISINFSSTN